jgi:hypothetical protein
MYAAHQEATSLQRDATSRTQNTDHQEQEQVSLEAAWDRTGGANQARPFAEQYAEIDELKARTKNTAPVWTTLPFQMRHQAMWCRPMISRKSSPYPMQFLPGSFWSHLSMEEKEVEAEAEVEAEVDEALQWEVEGLKLKAKL